MSCAVIKSRPPVHIIGIKEGAKNTGPYKELLENYGLNRRKNRREI